MSENRNTYLDQVVANQERLEQDLRSKRAAPVASMPAQAQMEAPMPASAPGGLGGLAFGRGAAVSRTDAARTAASVEVRVTGRWRWKTVVVPPNAFVVHTRRGRGEPLNVGLGISFKFNPYTDSFLVVPGAMQTILISAFCICKELQGLLVQAYVQWIIQDFSVAYRKLDFSDAEDPMRLVNLQLKEQAEAAIKDKVATMNISEVLSDKQPIIEELVERLRAVAEGAGGSDTGLGLRIVTVQIKEAVVSSSRLWENLQKPFRAEQSRVARLAELAAEEIVAEREMAAQQVRETHRIDTEQQLSDLRARAAAVEYDRETAERLRRAEQEESNARSLADLAHETALHQLNLERARADEETEIARMRIERDNLMAKLGQDGKLDLARAEVAARHEQAMLQLDRDRARADIDNAQSPANLQAKLIGSLPQIVEHMPKPKELKAVTIGGNDSTTLAGLVAELSTVVGAMRSAITDSRG
jgi:regulator of protease activity HflC (stomatin/prohibitin superfamily)